MNLTPNYQFWVAIITGIVTWVLGSILWQVFFVPKMQEKGFM